MRSFAPQRNPSRDPRQARTVPPVVHDALRSPGHPLDAETRAFMEPRFGHDFSQVRVHQDSQAAESAREVGALAYTVGRDVIFAQGRFAPHTASGRSLLAHELAHTVQQSAAARQGMMGDLGVGPQHDPLEQEAEKVSASVLSARAGVPSEGAPGAPLSREGRPALRRQPGPGGGDPPVRTLPPKEEGGEKAPKPAEPVCKPPSDIALPCRPKGLPNDEFLKTGAPKDAFGYTIVPAKQTFSVPEVRAKPAGKDNRVVLEKTKATPASCESFFTKAGRFWRTISIDPKDPKQSANAEKCGGSYRREYKLTPDGEKKVLEAELEHCTDLKHAFDISLGCYENVVNALAKTQFPSQEAAVDAVTKRAGRTPDTWGERYYELLAMTAKRDIKKWHTSAEPKGPGLELEIDRRGTCQSRFPTEVNEKSFPQVGKKIHPTPDVIQ